MNKPNSMLHVSVIMEHPDDITADVAQAANASYSAIENFDEDAGR
jgi:hypothetical protein